MLPHKLNVGGGMVSYNRGTLLKVLAVLLEGDSTTFSGQKLYPFCRKHPTLWLWRFGRLGFKNCVQK